VEVEEGGWAKADLLAAQGGDFGDPRAAVIHGQQEGVIAAAHPVGPVRCCQQDLHFFPREIADQLFVFPLERDGQHTGRDGDTLGLSQDHEPKEGAQGRQPNVARAHRIAAVVLQVVQKPQHQRGIEIGHPQRRGFDSGRLFDEGEQEAERVAATRDRLRTDAFLVAEMFRKERLDVRRNEHT
jgi:hypothetical protein